MSGTRIVPCPSCASLNRVPLAPAGDTSSSGAVAKCGKCKSNLDTKSAVFSVNTAGLQKIVLNSPIPVVVDFWAPWCGPCLGFAPTFQQQAESHNSKALYLKIDTEAQSDVGGVYNIRSIPTLIVFEGETEKSRQSGAMPLSSFRQWLQKTIGHS
jgi:thioredoxin 2